MRRKKKEKLKTQTENEKRKYIASPTFTVLHSIYEIALKSSTNTFLKLKNLTQLDQKTNFHINNPFFVLKVYDMHIIQTIPRVVIGCW